MSVGNFLLILMDILFLIVLSTQNVFSSNTVLVNIFVLLSCQKAFVENSFLPKNN